MLKKKVWVAVPAWAPSTGRQGQMDSGGLLSCHTGWIGSMGPVRSRWTTIEEEYLRLTSGLHTMPSEHAYTRELNRQSGTRTSKVMLARKLQGAARPCVFWCHAVIFLTVYSLLSVGLIFHPTDLNCFGNVFYSICVQGIIIFSLMSLGPLNRWWKTQRFWTRVAVAWLHLLSEWLFAVDFSVNLNVLLSVPEYACDTVVSRSQTRLGARELLQKEGSTADNPSLLDERLFVCNVRSKLRGAVIQTEFPGCSVLLWAPLVLCINVSLL